MSAEAGKAHREDLSKRDLKILRSVVDLYIREGVPVSSRRIKEYTSIQCSSATVRSVLAGLERKGLLAKPHTSAGRVPTDDGYRFFVDALEPDPSYSQEVSAMFREKVRELHDIHTIMSRTSRFLGGLSRNFAVVYGALLGESSVRKVNLMELEGPRLLVIVNLVPEYERTAVLRMERRFPAATVARAQELINGLVRERTLEEAGEALDRAIRDNITDEGIIMREVAVNRETIFSEPPAVELYFEDREHFLDQPELSDPMHLQVLLRLLHNKEYLTSILSKRLEEKTRITIGRENEEEALHNFSLVTSGYRMGSSRGVLGIIGPTRMRYDLASTLVGSIARELRALGEEIF